MFNVKFLIAFVVYCMDVISAKPFIGGLQSCKRSDPKLNQCFLNIIKQVKPHFIHGNPELNFPSLDPIHIDSLSLFRTLQDIKVTGELYNLTAKGANSITAKTVDVDLEEKTWDMVVNVPLITFETNFNLNITLQALHMPIFGRGQCHGKISQSVVRFHANTEVNDGKLVLKDVKVNLHLGDMDVFITKAQNPALAQTASQFFNANKRLVLDLVMPIAEDATNDLLLRYGNRILSHVKFTDVLMD